MHTKTRAALKQALDSVLKNGEKSSDDLGVATVLQRMIENTDRRAEALARAARATKPAASGK